ncbi:hypothetical protein GMDG_08414 [Pseudogymnoascus destructans 20631-21]|uniref:CCHC-type domain-containing protein n=1 Tax=Pseudogymnoascus destructans (strain ATCC MYA-4855 / 20631-21) TaxID=658429 RepID=L8G2F4_PSED2|nr:hypothetical protein GMDG_08414 [Pseudogymnoascus destructans 20631-21]
MVSNILLGLPSSYRTFKKQYDWIRAKNPDEEHDLSFLFDRLFIEEEDQENQKKERKANQKDTESKEKGKGHKSQDDRSNLKCTGCNKWGHLEEACWTTHPELKPKNMRAQEGQDAPADKPKAASTSHTQSRTPRHAAALAAADVDNFKANLMDAAQSTIFIPTYAS